MSTIDVWFYRVGDTDPIHVLSLSLAPALGAKIVLPEGCFHVVESFWCLFQPPHVHMTIEPWHNKVSVSSEPVNVESVRLTVIEALAKSAESKGGGDPRCAGFVALKPLPANRHFLACEASETCRDCSHSLSVHWSYYGGLDGCDGGLFKACRCRHFVAIEA